jgi:hypothetical protein
MESEPWHSSPGPDRASASATTGTSQVESYIPTHSSSTSREDLHCCCGRKECAYLQNNHVALEGLEKDLETAARLGQVRSLVLMHMLIFGCLGWLSGRHLVPRLVFIIHYCLLSYIFVVFCHTYFLHINIAC